MKRPCRAVYQLENAAEDHRRDLSDSLKLADPARSRCDAGFGVAGVYFGPLSPNHLTVRPRAISCQTQNEPFLMGGFSAISGL